MRKAHLVGVARISGARYQLAVEPKSKADQDKLYCPAASSRGSNLQGVLRTKRQAKPLLPAWASYLEIIVDRPAQGFKVEANIGKPQVA